MTKSIDNFKAFNFLSDIACLNINGALFDDTRCDGEHLLMVSTEKRLQDFLADKITFTPEDFKHKALFDRKTASVIVYKHDCSPEEYNGQHLTISPSRENSLLELYWCEKGYFYVLCKI